MEILLATHNEHKKDEIQEILGEKYHVTSLTDYQLFDEIPFTKMPLSRLNIVLRKLENQA